MLGFSENPDHTQQYKIILTPQQKKRLEEKHDSTRNGRVRERIKAVLLAYEGWSQVMISQALRINESTVTRHFSDCFISEKFKPENGCSQSRLFPFPLNENQYAYRLGFFI